MNMGVGHRIRVLVKVRAEDIFRINGDHEI